MFTEIVQFDVFSSIYFLNILRKMVYETCWILADVTWVWLLFRYLIEVYWMILVLSYVLNLKLQGYSYNLGVLFLTWIGSIFQLNQICGAPSWVYFMWDLFTVLSFHVLGNIQKVNTVSLPPLQTYKNFWLFWCTK